jgi:predicted O-methyltransferase YrrM
MRHIIQKKEWDRYYYYSKHQFLQKKMLNESESAEMQKVATCLNELQSFGMISSTSYDPEKFLAFRSKVKANFFIYWTAINPPMERLLYALSSILQPKTILGLGVFTGNPVVWSLGPAIDQLYPVQKMEGVEINQDHARIGQENFNKIKTTVPINFRGEDAFEVIKQYKDGEVDLLYLDANGKDPETGRSSKRINYSLAKAAYEKIRPGGWMMCHNAYEKSFRKEAGAYLDFCMDERYFTKTCTIGIDEMGLEFSIKKTT